MITVNLLPLSDVLVNEAEALVQRGHSICLDPTAAQIQSFKQCAGTDRHVGNWALAEWNSEYAAGGKPDANALKKKFNAVKLVDPKMAWLQEMPRDTQSQPFADLRVAWSNYFSSLNGTRKGPKMGRPSFKCKGKSQDSFYVANDKLKVRVCVSKNGKKRGAVRLPRIGWVRMTEALRWPGKILNARVVRKADRWYVSFTVAVRTEGAREAVRTKTLTAQRAAYAPKREIVGVDLGLKTAVMPSRGMPFYSPKPLLNALAQLRRANRTLHRRTKKGKNRHKAQMKLARIHAHIANIRKDFWHKLTTTIIRENQAVVLEDLKLGFMIKNRKLSRAAHDVAMGMFRPMMTYKAAVAMVELHVADRCYPSTQRCRCCGAIKGRGDGAGESLALSDRMYVCDVCGHVEERDLNAAHNLEQYPRLAGNWRRGTSCKAGTDERTSTEIVPLRAGPQGLTRKRGRQKVETVKKALT